MFWWNTHQRTTRLSRWKKYALQSTSLLDEEGVESTIKWNKEPTILLY